MSVRRSRYRPDVAEAQISRRAMAQNPVLGLARAVAPAIIGSAFRGLPASTAKAIVDDFTARGAAIERNERHKDAALAAAEAKRQRKAARRLASADPFRGNATHGS